MQQDLWGPEDAEHDFDGCLKDIFAGCLVVFLGTLLFVCVAIGFIVVFFG